MSKKAYIYKSVSIPDNRVKSDDNDRLNVEFNKGFELHTTIRESNCMTYILKREIDFKLSGSVVLKMVCTSNKSDSYTEQDLNGQHSVRIADIKFNAVVDGSPENEEFFNLTPAAELSLSCVNEKAAEMLESGKEYYVYLVEA